jgi:hypothetical protein
VWGVVRVEVGLGVAEAGTTLQKAGGVSAWVVRPGSGRLRLGCVPGQPLCRTNKQSRFLLLAMRWGCRDCDHVDSTVESLLRAGVAQQPVQVTRFDGARQLLGDTFDCNM